MRLNKRRAKAPPPGETEQAHEQPEPAHASSAQPGKQRRALTHVGGEVSYSGAAELKAMCELALTQRSEESDTRAHVHGFHAYPARLHPLTANQLIIGLSRPEETVLDPFCGSGTVLVESVIARRNAQGTDLNPLATLLSQTKCNGLSPRNQEELLLHVQRIREFADERRRAKAGPLRKYGPTERELFDVHVLLELDSLRAGIEQSPKGVLHHNLQLILSSLLVKLSRQSSDTVAKAAPRRIAAGYPSKLFQMRAEEWVRQVQEYETLAPLPRTKVRTTTADARQLAPVGDQTIDLIVTSPPYPGVYDYYAHHAVRLRWMNLSAGELQDKELGSKRTLVRDPQGSPSGAQIGAPYCCSSNACFAQVVTRVSSWPIQRLDPRRSVLTSKPCAPLKQPRCHSLATPNRVVQYFTAPANGPTIEPHATNICSFCKKPHAVVDPMRSRPLIVVVCTANVCRSPMAHAIFSAEVAARGLECDIQSGGVLDMGGTKAAPDAQRVCELWETPMPKLVSTHVSALDLTEATRVFVMEPGHKKQLLRETQVDEERVHLLSDFDPHDRPSPIDDPMGLPLYAFQDCYRRLRECIVEYLDTTDDFN